MHANGRSRQTQSGLLSGADAVASSNIQLTESDAALLQHQQGKHQRQQENARTQHVRRLQAVTHQLGALASVKPVAQYDEANPLDRAVRLYVRHLAEVVIPAGVKLGLVKQHDME